MNILESVQMTLGFIYEGVARLFSPNQDDYPMVGASAFEGDIYKGSNWAD
ncbi:MAG: isochorismate synthase [Okeania sp. SIO2H7]|nr:isochorismate synthase [Okeania sp. SIO2H7]